MMRLQQGFATSGMGFRGQFAGQQSSAAHVRFGSKADIARDQVNVRFTPKSGHWNSAAKCPLCADNFAINEAPNVLQEFGGYAQNNGANGGYSVQVGGDIPYLAKGVLSLDDDCAQGLIH